KSPVSTTLRKKDCTKAGEITSAPLEIDGVENGGKVVHELTVRAWLRNPSILIKFTIIFACVQDVSYSYLPLFLTDTLKFEKECFTTTPTTPTTPLRCLMRGATFVIVQKLFPEESSSEDGQECNARHVFSIHPVSIALLSLLTVLLFQSLKAIYVGKALKVNATSKSDETRQGVVIS
ncbi:uncharacterized protein LOC113674781, partial [Pocillopora damicornis]|uniref:uncharacterized protein LOC113674781 n=1 Tax=Pocillopora damicornis TaxID=46731 RepID=UPI000F556BE3